MKKIITFWVSLCLLTGLSMVQAENSALASVQTYIDNDFSSSSDTIGWVVSGDDLDATSTKNWSWNSYLKYYKLGSTHAATSTDIYTLTSPAIVLSNRGANLTFDYSKYEYNSHFNVYVLSGGVRTNLTNNLPGTGSDWATMEYSLESFASQTIQIVFEQTLTEMHNTKVDNVKVIERELCPQAQNLALSSLTTTSAGITWDNSTSDTYTLVLTSTPQTDPSSTSTADLILKDTITATTSVFGWNYTMTGLTPGMNYYVYLRSDCSASLHGYGDWSEAFNFSTPCTPQAAPYTENFDHLVAGEMPTCWISNTSFETKPAVITALNGDNVDTTQVFSIANNMNSEVMVMLPMFTSNVEDLMISFKAKTDQDGLSINVGLTNDLSSAQNIVTLISQPMTTDWEDYTIFLNNTTYTGSNYYIVLYLPSGLTSSTDAYHIYLDDINVETAPSCLFPLQVGVSDISTNSCTISWLDKNATSLNYTIEYTPLAGTPVTITTTSNPYTLTGLSPDTEYTIRVKANCTATDESAYSTVQSILTLKAPIIVTTEDAGVETFDQTSNAFTLVNGEEENHWAIGSAVSASPSRSLYLSGDHGATLGSINADEYSYVFAYADVEIPSAGKYKITFNWKGYSKSTSNSYMYAYFTTPSKEIIAGDSWSSSESDATSIGGKFTDTDNKAWTDFKDYVDVASAGTYRIVFYRKTKKGSYYANNYTCIDDISIEYVQCVFPSALNQTSIDLTSVGLTWNGTASNYTVKAFTSSKNKDNISAYTAVDSAYVSTNSATLTHLLEASKYYIYVQSNCDATHSSEWIGPLEVTTNCSSKDLPYSNSFNTSDGGDIPICWDGSHVYVTKEPSSYLSINDSRILEFSGDKDDPQYAILPTFNQNINQCVLEFDYVMRSSKYSNLMVVGYLTDASDYTTFVAIDSLAVTTDVTHALINYSTVADNVTGRLCIQQLKGLHSSNDYGASVDDIQVYEVPSCWPIEKFTAASRITDTEIRVNWMPDPNAAHSYILEYGISGFTPGTSEGTRVTLTDTTYLIQDLASSTSYDVYVTIDCGDVDGTSISKYETYTTIVTPIDASNYSFDFENDTEAQNWRFATPKNKNAWQIGDLSKRDGNKGLYVVDESGSLGYSNTSCSSWAYRHFHCTPGLYTVTYDYKCKGQSYYDFMSSYVVPSLFIPRADEEEGALYDGHNEDWHTGSPVGCTGQETWTTYTYDFTIDNDTDVTLLFFWHNNAYSNYDGPSVDNLSIYRHDCRPVYNFSVDSITTTAAQIQWESSDFDHFEVVVDTVSHGVTALDQLTSAVYLNRNDTNKTVSLDSLSPETKYFVYVHNICSDTQEADWSEVFTFTTLCNLYTLPYSDDFEKYYTEEMPICWTKLLGDDVHVTSSDFYDGTKSVLINTAAATTVQLALPQFIMTRAIEDYQLVFYAKKALTYTEDDIVIAVMESDDLSSTENMNQINTFDVTLTKDDEGTWKRIVVPFTHPMDIVTNDSIAIGQNPYIILNIPGVAKLYIDHLSVELKSDCQEPVNISLDSVMDTQVYYRWMGNSSSYEVRCTADDNTVLTRITTQDSVIFSGLNPHTTYNIKVRGVCSESSHSVWSESTEFTTNCSIETLPYVQDFESVRTPALPPCFVFSKSGLYHVLWESEKAESNTYLTLSATTKHYSAHSYVLTSPEIDMSNTAYGMLSFNMKGDGVDEMPTSVSVYDLTTGDAHSLMTEVLITESWTRYEVDLQAYKNHVIQLIFSTAVSVDSKGQLYFDNVKVEDKRFVTPPTGLRLDKIATTSAMVHLDPMSNITGREVVIIPESETFDENTTAGILMTADSMTITELNPSTYYKAYARALNGSGQSLWMGSVHFSTLCATHQLPLVADFEETVNGTFVLPLCWTKVGQAIESTIHPISGQGAVMISSGSQFISPRISNELNTSEVYLNGFCESYSALTLTVKTDLSATAGLKIMDTIMIDQNSNITWNIPMTTLGLGYHYLVFTNTGDEPIYLDNLYVQAYNACRPPLSFNIGAIEKGQVNILIKDTATSNTNYDIALGLNTELDVQNLVPTLTHVGDSVWMTGLLNNQIYNVFVRRSSVSGPDTTYSQWIGPLTFTSACDDILISSSSPYQMNLEDVLATDYTTLPSCWRAVNTSGNSALPYAYEHYDDEDLKASIQVKSGDSASVYLVLPEFSNNLNFLDVSFYVKLQEDAEFSSADHIVTLGTLSSPNDTSSFNPCENVLLNTFSSSTYRHASYDMRYYAIPSDHHFIALRVENDTHAFNFNQFEVSVQEGCGKPIVSLNTLDSTSIKVDVQNVSTASSYDVYIKTSNGSYRDTTFNVPVDSTPYTVTGLNPGTLYYVKARAHCSGSTTSWSSSIHVITSHAIIRDYPFIANFEDTTDNKQWVINDGDLSNSWVIGVDASGIYQGSHALYISNDKLTPHYDITQKTFTWASRSFHFEPGAYTISFMAKVGGYTSGDVLRAFLVDPSTSLLPCNYYESTYDEFHGSTLLYSNVPEGFTDLLGSKHYISQHDWMDYHYEFIVKEATDYQLAFLWKSMSADGTQPGACVDNVEVHFTDCPGPKNIDIFDTKGSYIKVKADDKLEIPSALLHYAVVPRDSSITGANILDQDTALTGVPVTLGNLTADTDYDLYTARLCNGQNGAWSTALGFRTAHLPAAMPYTCGFETNETETSLWSFVNDGTNAWRIDTMAQATGAYSLYISNDNSSYNYYNRTTQYSYAVRTLHFEKGSYSLNFNWKGVGETDQDYMYLFLTPDEFYPEAGNTYINGTGISATMATPTDCYKFGPYMGQTAVTYADEAFYVEEACDLKLIVAWKNDAINGSNPPAMIDDLSIVKKTCVIPLNIVLDKVTAHTAELSWSSDAIGTHLFVTEDGATVPMIDTTLVDTTFIIDQLMESTTYSFQLYNICSSRDTSNLTTRTYFTTPCEAYDLPFDENFNLNQSSPNCWNQYSGTANLSGSTAQSDLQSSNEAWTHEIPAGLSPNQKISLAGSSLHQWLVTPYLNMNDKASLYFDVAISKYMSWDTPDDETDTDNQFAVLITRDYGNTWQVLESWTNESANGHKFYDLPSSFATQSLSIEAQEATMAGNPIRLAFYGSSTQNVTQNDIHIDNIHLNCMNSDTLEIYDTICMGYAYNNNGYSIARADVATGSYTQLIKGSTGTCDQIKKLHLFVNPSYDLDQTIVICQGQSYDFGGFDLTEAGDYIKTLSSVNGCDSTVNLTLIVTTLETNIDTTICEGNFLTLDTDTLRNSGLYLDTIRNSQGCDSVVRIQLTVIPTDTVIDTTICEGSAVEMAGVLYTQSGQYTTTLRNRLDCDSIITLNLNVIATDTSYTDVICEGSNYNFRGSLVTEAGVYRDTVYNYQNSGCEHHYELTLSVIVPDTVDIYDAFCEGSSIYSNYGFDINDPEAKAYYLTLTSDRTGCDSITVLHLTETKTITNEITQTICDNESFTFGGKDYYAQGDYSTTFTALSTGCDSLVTLHLFVNPSYEVDAFDSVYTDQLPYTNLTLTVDKGTPVGTYDYRIESQSTLGCDSIINLTLTIQTPDGLIPVTVQTLDFYPNVVNSGENVTITTSIPTSDRDGLDLRLYDVTGKLISVFAPASKGAITISSPAVSGMYFLRLTLESGITYGGKLIVL